MNVNFSFIVIDDDELDCYVTQKNLEKVCKNQIDTFLNAEQALDFIREKKLDDLSPLTIILLDLLMPLMSGFTFVEEFENLPADVKKKYVIIILTIVSTVGHPNDIYRILNYNTVNCLIEKPVTKEKLIECLGNINEII